MVILKKKHKVLKICKNVYSKEQMRHFEEDDIMRIRSNSIFSETPIFKRIWFASGIMLHKANLRSKAFRIIDLGCLWAFII